MTTTDQCVSVSGRNIRYRDSGGPGLPLVMTHGIGGLPCNPACDLQPVWTAKLIVLEDCGHTPHIEKPQAFNAALSGFSTTL